MRTGARSLIPRCGCCDRPNPVLICEDCSEPMCADHWKRVDAAFICVVCAEARVAARADASLEAGVYA